MSFSRNNNSFINRSSNSRRSSQNRTLNGINHSTTISNDLRLLLNLYISMYNNVNEQIDLLYEDLDMVRNNMQTVIQMILENNRELNDTLRNINRSNPFQRQTERQNRREPLSNIFRGLRERQRQQSQQQEEPIIQYDNDRNRIYINNIPYIIENVEYFNTTASTNTNTNQNQNHYREILQSFLDPITVRPTENQISSATRNINYGLIENPLNLSCPISLETFESDNDVTQIVHCGHIFNEDSLNQWFQSNVRCPVCRYDIRTNNTREEEEKKEDNDENEEIQPLTTILEEEEKEEEKQEEDPLRNTFGHFEQEYTREIENLLQNTANSLTNLFSREFEIQYRNDVSNNITSLFDPSNNVFLFETLFSIPPGNFRY
jgi:uncharacterized Zn finger protein (UPF0148 family)